MVTSAKKIKDKVSALNDDEVSALQELQHLEVSATTETEAA